VRNIHLILHIHLAQATTALTIWCKFKYPLEFFLCCLEAARQSPEPVSEISKIHKEMQEFNIKLLRPHITKSQLNFSIEGNDIRFGLLSIKGIADKSIEKLSKFKMNIPPNSKCSKALIRRNYIIIYCAA